MSDRWAQPTRALSTAATPTLSNTHTDNPDRHIHQPQHSQWSQRVEPKQKESVTSKSKFGQKKNDTIEWQRKMFRETEMER